MYQPNHVGVDHYVDARLRLEGDLLVVDRSLLLRPKDLLLCRGDLLRRLPVDLLLEVELGQ